MDRDLVLAALDIQVEDARYALGRQLTNLTKVLESVARTIQNGRMLNTHGEIQGEGNKLDALIAAYEQAKKMRHTVANFRG